MVFLGRPCIDDVRLPGIGECFVLPSRKVFSRRRRLRAIDFGYMGNQFPLIPCPIDSLDWRVLQDKSIGMAGLLSLVEAIKEQRDWLALQPNFQDGWDQGCTWVTQTIASWIAEYTNEMKLGDYSKDFMEKCSIRLWGTWAYHWRKASKFLNRTVDGSHVAERLEKGFSPTDFHRMGGSPLRDVVLAEAALALSDTAFGILDREYHDIFSQEARKVIHQNPDEDQWRDLLTVLVVGSAADSKAGHSGRLSAYKGYSSLKSWLRVVSHHHVLDSFRAQQMRLLAEQRFAAKQGWAAEDPDMFLFRETLELLAKGVAWALAGIPVRERYVLVLHFKEGWANDTIARAIKKSSGQATRIRAQATQRLIARLRSWLERSDAAPHLLDRIVEKDSSKLSQFLINAIADPINTRFPSEYTKTIEEGPIVLKTLKPRRVTKQATITTNPVVSIPAEMRHLIPDAILVTNQRNSPSDVFNRICVEAPAVVCVDARIESLRFLDMLQWQDELDQLLAERLEDDSNLYRPRRVVFHLFDEDRIRSELSSSLSPSEIDFWLSHPDVDWLQTSNEADDLQSLYQQMLVQDLGVLLGAQNIDDMSVPRSGNARDMMEFIPESEREQWRVRIEELQDEESQS